MVSVKMNDQPAAVPGTGATAGKSDAQVTLTDSRGRNLLLRELTLLQEQDLIAAMPPSHASNQFTFNRALLVARIASINGEPVEFPVTRAFYRGMLAQVGREGYEAVVRHIVQVNGKASIELLLSPTIAAALQAAAEDEGIPAPEMVERALRERLQSGGWIEEEEAASPEDDLAKN